DPVRVRGVWDGEEEARVIGEEIEALHRKGHRLNEIAILVRAGFQTREFEERFLTLGIPYRVIGGPRFYEREEIRDAIAYLRVIHQPDDDLAFERILNKPTRGIGPATVQALHGAARAMSRSLHAAALEVAQTDELKPAARRSLTAILDDFARWRRMGDGLGPVKLAETVLDESGYTAMWQQSRKPEAPGKLENLKELVTALREFDTLAGFLEHVSLVMENVENLSGDMVSIMTLHAAKGLEFDTVFLPGWEEGLFPHQRAMDESGVAGLEEERRLAYVGLTRARRRASISFAANRRIHNQWQAAIPSRFIDEIPPDHVLVESGGGLYAGLGEPARFAAEPVSPSFGGPGWRRYRERAGEAVRPAPRVIDAQAQYLEEAAAEFDAGDRCFHQKFGMGTVAAVDGSRLTIDFDHAGTKKVVAAYVQKPA
ncbi:MAG: 3'-5' exonuclease, partial [Alphaproteobacteria bacterium]